MARHRVCASNSFQSVANSPLIIRRATFADADLIARITRDAWANTVSQESGAHRDNADSVLHDLQSGGGLIASINNEVIASMRWFNLDTATRELKRIGVLAEYRGQGVAQQLMAEAIRVAKEDSVTDLRLAVRVDQPHLVKAYELIGFRIDTSLLYSHANPLSPPPVVMRLILV
jgi:ribosomal protein S18 acetylase RimI-like enzyme